MFQGWYQTFGKNVEFMVMHSVVYQLGSFKWLKQSEYDAVILKRAFFLVEIRTVIVKQQRKRETEEVNWVEPEGVVARPRCPLMSNVSFFFCGVALAARHGAGSCKAAQNRAMSLYGNRMQRHFLLSGSVGMWGTSSTQRLVSWTAVSCEQEVGG